MKTLTCTAKLYDQRNTSWASDYARQGKYDTILHRGLIVFPSLANNVLKGKNIKDIGLKFVCSSAGRSATKKAYFYTTTKTASGGSSTTWIDSANAVGTLSAAFYNATRTFPSLATSDASVFAKLKTFFENGGQALGIFINESVTSSSVSYSSNYLSFTSVVMTITYEEGNIRRYNGNEWVGCTPYYHNGTGFVKCDAYYHTGTEWKK